MKAPPIQMIADAMGWRLDRVVEQVAPQVADRAVRSDFIDVAPGQVAGVVQTAAGYVGDEVKVSLRLEAYLGAPESYDSVLIDGSPRIHSKIEGGVHGDIATASMTVNSIPAVIVAPPAWSTYDPTTLPTPRATAATRRSCNSCELGIGFNPRCGA